MKLKPIVKSPTRLVIGEVRTSYCHLFEPHGFDGATPKYSAVLLIPKDDTATADAVRAAIKAAYEEGVVKKWAGKRPRLQNETLRDGDGEDREGNPYPDEYHSCWFLNAKSTGRPALVRRDMTLIDSEEEFYSGCYAVASVSFFPYDANGNKGVGCSLNNLMKTRDGERLGGGASAAADFADVDLTGLPEFGDDDL